MDRENSLFLPVDRRVRRGRRRSGPSEPNHGVPKTTRTYWLGPRTIFSLSPTPTILRSYNSKVGRTLVTGTLLNHKRFLSVSTSGSLLETDVSDPVVTPPGHSLGLMSISTTRTDYTPQKNERRLNTDFTSWEGKVDSRHLFLMGLWTQTRYLGLGLVLATRVTDCSPNTHEKRGRGVTQRTPVTCMECRDRTVWIIDGFFIFIYIQDVTYSN